MGVVDKLNQIKSCKEDIKQAIIDKGVDMTDVAFTEYATKISEIQAGGGDFLDVKANLTSYTSNREVIPVGAFTNIEQLTSVNLPNCVSVGNNAFYFCTSLQSVNIPMCSYVGSSAFAYCSSLQSIDLPNCVSVGNYAFTYCTSLQSLTLPLISITGGSMCERCYKLSYIDLPKCEAIGDSFEYCSSLTSVNLPNCARVENYAFAYCPSLQSVNIPMCSYVGNNAFSSCSSLTVLDLRSAYSCALSNSNTFSRTPFASGIGSIYVHAAHLSQFQNATNWTYFSNCFVGVGDPDRPLLAFDSGRVYGDAFAIYNNYLSYLGIRSSSVTSIDLPNVRSLYSTNWFSYYSKLTELCMSSLEVTPQDLVRECVLLQSVNLPNCVSVGNNTFYYCTSLQSVNIPICSYVGDNAFNRCSSLTTIDLPNCVSVGNYAFTYCSSLQSVNIPICSYVGDNAFTYCSSLQSISLPMCGYLGERPFGDALQTLYIGTSLSTVCVLYKTLTLNDNIQSIFVPMSLVNAYKTAQYWSQYASRIFGI